MEVEEEQIVKDVSDLFRWLELVPFLNKRALDKEQKLVGMS